MWWTRRKRRKRRRRRRWRRGRRKTRREGEGGGGVACPQNLMLDEVNTSGLSHRALKLELRKSSFT